MVLQLQAHHAYRLARRARADIRFHVYRREAWTPSMSWSIKSAVGVDAMPYPDGFPDMESFTDGRRRTMGARSSFDPPCCGCRIWLTGATIHGKCALTLLSSAQEYAVCRAGLIFRIRQEWKITFVPAPSSRAPAHEFKQSSSMANVEQNGTYCLVIGGSHGSRHSFLGAPKSSCLRPSRRPTSPGHIHNETLMRKMGSNQLLPRLECGRHYEVRADVPVYPRHSQRKCH